MLTNAAPPLQTAVNRLMAQGFTLRVDGARLMVSPGSKLTPQQRAWLRAQNDALVELLTAPASVVALTPAPDTLTPAEREDWEERRAILEYDAHLPRAAAEAQALRQVLDKRIAPGSLAFYRRLDNLPDKPCPACGQGHYWLTADSGGWQCSHCVQPAPVKPEDLPAAVRAWHARDTCCVPVSADTGPVHCGDCHAFTPDAMGNGSGLGACQRGHPGRYPREAHPCASFTPPNLEGIPMLSVLTSGTLVKDGQRRISAKGSAYATAAIRVAMKDADAIIANVIAFDDDLVALLSSARKGDAATVTGTATISLWTPEGGDAKPSLSITANRIVTVVDKAAAPRPRPSAPPPHAERDPFDDFERMGW